MALKLNNYNNIFIIIYRSFFCKKLYNHIFKQGKFNIFLPLFTIIVITYLVPCLMIKNRLANFTYSDNSNILAQELSENITLTPEIIIKNGKLIHENNPDIFPYYINIPSLNKNIISFDPKANSLIAHNSVILFSNEKVIFSLPELVVILLKLVNLNSPPLSQITQHNSNYELYPNKDINFNGATMLNLSEEYINSLAKLILYPISLIIIFLTILLKFVEILILSFITKFIAQKNQISLNFSQAFNLTAIALIPTLIIKALNAMSLWSSNLLTVYPISTLLLLAINLYYINFAVKAAKSN